MSRFRLLSLTLYRSLSQHVCVNVYVFICLFMYEHPLVYSLVSYSLHMLTYVLVLFHSIALSFIHFEHCHILFFSSLLSFTHSFRRFIYSCRCVVVFLYYFQMCAVIVVDYHYYYYYSNKSVEKCMYNT